jgi:pyruvate dehydrogenase E2 component (dihydrolipoamide acetyltransferase)
MPVEITMPQLSDTMTDGTLVKWHKNEGDKVKAGDKIADVETDKAVMEVESFEAGTLAAIMVPQGSKIPVGAVMAVLAVGQENPADIKKTAGAAGTSSAAASSAPQAAAPAQSAPAPAAAAPQAALAQREPARRETAQRQQSASGQSTGSAAAGTATLEQASRGEMHEPDHVGHGATREPPTAVPPMPVKPGNGNPRIRISPLARRIAADKQIDPQTLQGSGPGGRIVKQDVLNHATSAPSADAGEAVQNRSLQPSGNGSKQIIGLTKMRAAIAKALQASKQTIPHFYETIDVDVEELTALRVRLNEMLEPEKVRLSLSDFLAKAIASALLRHPVLNSTFNGTEITRHSEVHLGMAVSIPDGLIVPVLRNVQQMGLKEIRQKTVDLVDRARAQHLRQDEMTGGTFTTSNLGTYGIREFSAIINPPQVGILAIAAAEKRPVVRNNQIVARTMLTMTLSADHRIVDGATAAEFLRSLKGLLEEPGMMLA